MCIRDRYAPDMWGIDLEQLSQVTELEGFDEGMKMYDVVDQLVKPRTKGTGLGYALYLNQQHPLHAKVMVSHAWGEKYQEFISALMDAGGGPLWAVSYTHLTLPTIYSV
eukprot:TRINITY_DN7800_c0_g1_i1.p2 TRINITY_DN7800_c0_g1~~TRINITY_DN7800_c0_g1_i1.p2  ORF type:complete len:109 (-),score=34.77 TRINITY_DN7800_c0_g1_i1:123-449(-)